MITDEIHSLSGAYAVDAVDAVDQARFEAHLAGCSPCQAEVITLRAAASELSLTTSTAPPPSLRASVLRDISSVRPLPPKVTSHERPAPELVRPANPSSLASKRAERARQAPRRQWLAGVAAAAVLATGGLLWHPWTSGTNTAQLTATQQVLQAKDAQRSEKKLGTLTTAVVRSASLNEAVIVTTNLPAAPHGKVYELWLQQGTTMVKAGFMPAGGSNAVLLHGNAATAIGADITIEPAGGSDKPTLPPVAQIKFA